MENTLNSQTTVAETPILVRFRNVNSNLYLSVDGIVGEGAPMEQKALNTSDSEIWKLEYNEEDDTFVIRPKSRIVDHLTVHNCNTTNGERIILWSGTAAKWKIQYDEENDAHRIVSQFDSFAKGIAVAGDSRGSGAQICIWEKKTTVLSDRWIVEFV